MVTERLNQADVESDLRLADAAAQGDVGARRRLAERLFDRTRALTHYLAAGDRDADDLAQLALVAVLKSVRTYRGECSLERWADRIVVRCALRELKRRRWRETIVGLVAEPRSETPEDPEQRIQRRLFRRHLASLLGRLSEERRTAVTLHWMHGYSVAEIAELTDAPVNTVRDRLRVGKKQLRTLLTKDPALEAWARSVLYDGQ